MESLFPKIVTPEACNRTKYDAITGVYSWEYSFSFLLFLKKKAATGEVPWKKLFLKILKFTGKHLRWSLFLKKTAGFKNTYFEEHLWTTASKNINICLTVKVLVLRGIKLLNINVNKKKNMCENLTSEVMWHKNCSR